MGHDVYRFDRLGLHPIKCRQPPNDVRDEGKSYPSQSFGVPTQLLYFLFKARSGALLNHPLARGASCVSHKLQDTRRLPRIAPLINRRLLTAALAFLPSLNLAGEAIVESREQYASVFPFEVGLRRLEGNSRRHFMERCSAFLVSRDHSEAILVSAWHCIDGELSLHRQPTVSVFGKSVDVTIMQSGNTMESDWLVMRAPSDAFSALTPISISSRPVVADEALIAIGWGRRTEQSSGAPNIIQCPVSEARKSLRLRCALTKGDSGGVVARELEDGQIEAVGIISSGDSTAITFAFPMRLLPDIID